METIKGDVLKGDYIYRKRPEGRPDGFTQGWDVVGVLDNTKTEYGPIENKINGEPVTHMTRTFFECENMIKSPKLPNSVVCMDFTYGYCNSLTVAPNLPKNIERMYATFTFCENLRIPPKFPKSIKELKNVFFRCENLTTAPDLSHCAKLKDIYSLYCGCTALKTYVGAKEGTPDGDFSGYVIPNGVIDISNAFMGCNNIILPPKIHQGIKHIYGTFWACKNLTTAPDLSGCPNLEHLGRTFCFCPALKTYVGAKEGTPDGDFSGYVIPEGISGMYETFRECTSLTVAPKTPNSVMDMAYTYEGCTSLSIIPKIPDSVPTPIWVILKNCPQFEFNSIADSILSDNEKLSVPSGTDDKEHDEHDGH